MYVSTPKFGSPAKLEPPSAAAERARIVEDSVASAKLSKLEPRIIQACVQCIANLACDNEPGADGESTVDKIVLAGAVTVLGFVMNSHLDKVGRLAFTSPLIAALANASAISFVSFVRGCATHLVDYNSV